MSHCISGNTQLFSTFVGTNQSSNYEGKDNEILLECIHLFKLLRGNKQNALILTLKPTVKLV